jgi:hypothetical protein
VLLGNVLPGRGRFACGSGPPRRQDLALQQTDVEAGRLLERRGFRFRGGHPQEEADLAPGDPARPERLGDQGQVGQPPVDLHELLHETRRDPEALHRVVGGAGEAALQIPGGGHHPRQQPAEPQIERVSHHRQAAQVAIQEERREVTHDVALLVLRRRREEMVRNERGFGLQMNGLGHAGAPRGLRAKWSGHSWGRNDRLRRGRERAKSSVNIASGPLTVQIFFQIFFRPSARRRPRPSRTNPALTRHRSIHARSLPGPGPRRRAVPGRALPRRRHP